MKNQQNKLKAAYMNIFSTPEGEAVFQDLVKFCGANQTSFVPGDVNSTAYKEGMRRVFLRVNSFVNKDFNETLNNNPQRRL